MCLLTFCLSQGPDERAIRHHKGKQKTIRRLEKLDSKKVKKRLRGKSPQKGKIKTRETFTQESGGEFGSSQKVRANCGREATRTRSRGGP